MLLLSIDTSIRGCSVAVHENSGLLASYDLNTDKSSSSILTTLIKSAVEHSGYDLADLDAVAIAKGPGSYTGLRVGVSTAKGLCYALDKPLIAINTLQAMALQVAPFYAGHLLCPMIDARRMEVYAAVFDDQNNFVWPTQAVIMNDASFQDLLTDHKVVFFGDGAAKCKPLLLEHPNAIFPEMEIRPSAITIGKLAVQAFETNQFEDVAAFEPYYLKDFMSPPPKKANLTV
ncbi:tRNA (adenosine(37)-N6)-threonylcarbamoyltransferase complex dimerization subunit type 1 TsaB [Dyadobacter sediminis]|uniref:tRNA (Adenosine(37)-N6)-threonylcarbamoyltransferase complex dimerization subunit type 1 TsaB n=1 Tax=Dyadobacter sediminis TaxID=1493691 RepID=A0A5R9K656_9BACT|nr:tRNA (adenosine(37)-N6)-threonylcarbamoyltransferase complex dimerization subunit type 1 TsaB [Dyadobacter sediminis]TLU89143.1 tRNA (adenosine(37)-N6)-threonylcarbamoyltransferase complex dimerization subunit type 1 TsaB [Dyadobacter sediminis]GGC02481.1 tRNA (adenosine(37)-N6)-threonylcarbamoyltransferase complex dimerization subunit type 1 TsaB [Dyadobacter sediminis]